jgi:hypothetical protein
MKARLTVDKSNCHPSYYRKCNLAQEPVDRYHYILWLTVRCRNALAPLYLKLLKLALIRRKLGGKPFLCSIKVAANRIV